MENFVFAHLADVHLGAFREPELRELNARAFEAVLDACSEADFLVIAGDLFDTPLPDLSIVDRAVKKMRALVEQGKKIYLVYGSHDYSVNETSVIDVLNSAGVITKITGGKAENNRIKLDFTKDEATGALLTGLSARKRGLELENYEALDLNHLQERNGFKVFAFHSGIEEHKPDFLKGVESIPLSLLPKGFDYYAGGHVHKRIDIVEKNYGRIVYPGPLFAADYKDLDDLAEKEHGFYMVRVKGGEVIAEFKPIKVAEVVKIGADANEKSASALRDELLSTARETKAIGKIILLRVAGELASGNPGEVGFNEVRSAFEGALVVKVNRSKLTAPKLERIKVEGEDKRAVEKALFKSLANGKWSHEPAAPLLEALKQPRSNEETKTNYEERVKQRAFSLLEGLK